MPRARTSTRRKPSMEFMLGKLASDVNTLVQNGERARIEHEQMAKDIGDMKVQMAGFNAVALQVAEMKPHVEDYKKMKQRGIGIWLVVTLLGTVGGGWILRKMGVPAV